MIMSPAVQDSDIIKKNADDVSSSTGLYIHWPYCLSKCPYCDFNSHVLTEISEEKWIEAYHKALDQYSDQLKEKPIKSVFFGGGTPSLMPLTVLDSILDYLYKICGYLPDEITLEANPTSFEIDKFKSMADLGINRLSIGVQSLNDDSLKFLGREHDSAAAIRAFEVSRNIFSAISFDLIYALPGQSVLNWERELLKALSYAPDHLSLYQLTIEPGTRFFQDHKRGVFEMPSEEHAADLYEVTQKITMARGLRSYEVSNYAKPGFECQHNLIYWKGSQYIGIGPGAHGRLAINDGSSEKWYATQQKRAPHKWLDAILTQTGEHEAREFLTQRERAVEVFMTALRVEEGIALTELDTRFTDDWRSVISLECLDILKKEGYVRDFSDRICLTPEGRLVLDSVIDFVVNTNPLPISA